MSPSRNHTPGTICFIVFGCASPCVRKNVTHNIAPKHTNNMGRTRFISASADTMKFQPNSIVNPRRGRMAAQARRRSVAVAIGPVKVGGNNPIVVQSMTNTDTADVQSTVNQVMALATAGAELVRVTVNTEAAAAAVPKIVDTWAMFGGR